MSGDSVLVDSDMSTSVNSDASYDIDIVRHHDGRNVSILPSVIPYFQWPHPPPTCWTPGTLSQTPPTPRRRSVRLENQNW